MKIIDKLFKRLGYVPYSEYRESLDKAEEETANWKVRYDKFNDEYIKLYNELKELRIIHNTIKIGNYNYDVHHSKMTFYTNQSLYKKVVNLAIYADDDAIKQLYMFAMDNDIPLEVINDRVI